MLMKMKAYVEASRALLYKTAFAEQTAHYSMIRDPQGNRKGWTYCFADYWGPYSWGDANNGKGVTFFASNFRVIQPMGYIYHATGHSEYLGVLRDAFKQPRRGGYSGGVIAGWMAVKHPKADATPPSPISDVKAEAVGGAKVKLTWTAPGDAAWYQVKWSTARIVERVKGWPDRTPPLPTDGKEWHAKAEAFNAKQRAFWGANNAPNAPTPQEAGKAETMTVAGLPPGRVYFAAKSWDGADNVSKLSNVASVDVW